MESPIWTYLSYILLKLFPFPRPNTSTVEVRAVDISSDGQTLLTSGDNVAVWNLSSLTRRELPRLYAGSFKHATIAGTDFATLLCIDEGDTGLFFDLHTGRQIQKGPILNIGSDNVLSLAVSRLGDTIVAGHNRQISVSTSYDPPYTVDILGPVLDVDISRDGQSAAFASMGGYVGILPLKGEQRGKWSFVNTHQAAFSVAFHPTKQLFISTHEEDVRLWEIGAMGLSNASAFKGSEMWVRTVSFHPSGNLFATGSSDGTIKIWTFPGLKLYKQIDAHNDEVLSLQFRPGTNQVISSASDGTVKFWAIDTGTLLATLVQFSSLNWIAYTPEGAFVSSQPAEAQRDFRKHYPKKITFAKRQNASALLSSLSPRPFHVQAAPGAVAGAARPTTSGYYASQMDYMKLATLNYLYEWMTRAKIEDLSQVREEYIQRTATKLGCFSKRDVQRCHNELAIKAGFSDKLL